MKWLFQSQKETDRKAAREASLKAAIASSDALEKAAKGTMTLAQDVTETLQAKLDDYAQQIEQTSRLLADALLLVDTHGIIESFNPAAEAMFGWKKRYIIGKSISALFQFPEGTKVNSEFMESFMGLVNSDEPLTTTSHHEEFMGVKEDGTTIYIDVGASKLVRRDKQTHYIILIRNVTHRVKNGQMMRELAERNQELVTTIDASNTGFVILENDGSDYKVTFVNEGFARLTKTKRRDLKKMSLRDLLGIDKGYWTVRRTLGEEVTARHEVQLELESASDIWFDVHITPVIKGHQAHQWILVFYDTTELKKAYQNLRKSEAHFRAFSDASSESMFIHDNSSLLDWNERLITLTGYSESELQKINPLDFVHPLEREHIRVKLDSDAPESYETLLMTKSGDVREVAFNSRPIEWDNAEAQIVVARDVTAFKDIDTQLKASRERYKTVIDNTIDMVVCFNAKFEITFSNQTFRDYFDVELDDINGFALLDVIPQTDHEKFIAYMLSISPEAEVRRGIHRIQRHNETRWQDWIDRGIFDDDGKLIEIQSVARDVTHLMPSQ